MVAERRVCRRRQTARATMREIRKADRRRLLGSGSGGGGSGGFDAEEDDDVVEDQAEHLEEFPASGAPNAHLAVRVDELTEALVLQQVVLGEARVSPTVVDDRETFGTKLGVNVE